MPPEYDPSNVEHVTRLATALGFTDVIIVIGQPGLTTNGWRATYRGQRFTCEAPHLFKQTTDEARKILARDLHRRILAMVASGRVQPAGAQSAAGEFVYIA